MAEIDLRSYTERERERKKKFLFLSVFFSLDFVGYETPKINREQVLREAGQVTTGRYLDQHPPGDC